MVNYQEVWGFLTSVNSDYQNERATHYCKSVYEKLMEVKPIKSDTRITFFVSDELNILFVYGVDINGEHVNLDCPSWGEWAGMEILDDIVSDYNDYEIVAYCLREMTYMDLNEERIERELREDLNIKI